MTPGPTLTLMTFDKSKVEKEEMECYNKIHSQVIERGGWFKKSEAKWLFEFEKKAKLCNNCKGSLSRNSMPAIGKDRYGNDLSVGCMSLCLECECKSLWQEGESIFTDH